MSTRVRSQLATATYRVKLQEKPPRSQTRLPGKTTARVPRVARLLALAHRIDRMIRSGELKNWAEAAELVGVTRARMTQIANLMLLAPEIQALILNCELTIVKHNHTTERHYRLILLEPDWAKQGLAYMRPDFKQLLAEPL